ncbi:MAG: hypothetical protein ACT4N4_10155 [Rhodospirillales bacterium]
MTDDPVARDKHRGMAAQRATEIRRRLAEVAADQALLRQRQIDMENFLVASPALTWHEAAEKIRYLVSLFAAAPAAQDPRHQKLIASILADLNKLDGTATASDK